MKAVERTAAIATIVATIIALLTYFGIKHGKGAPPPVTERQEMPRPDTLIERNFDQALAAAKSIASPWRRDDALERLVETAIGRRESRVALAAAEVIAGPGSRDDMLYQIVLYGVLIRDFELANRAAALIASPRRGDEAKQFVSERASTAFVARRPFVTFQEAESAATGKH